MYTILIDGDNRLLTTVAECIMQKSKLVDKLQFLTKKDYKGHDMSKFTVTMEYILPVSKEYHVAILEMSECEHKKDWLRYVMPMDTYLTNEAGKIEIACITFSYTDLDAEGGAVQYVRKTSSTTLNIVPIANYSAIVPDSALTELDKRIAKTDAQIKELESLAEALSEEKADNLKLSDNTLQLTANGKEIGDAVNLENLGENIAESSHDGTVKIVNF